MQNSLFERLTIGLGQLALRSDVEVISRRVGAYNGNGHLFDAKSWSGVLSAEASTLYARLNGYAMSWRFQSESQLHGPLLHALVAGKKTVDLRTGSFGPPLGKASVFGRLSGGKGPIETKGLRSVLLEGSDDAAGLLWVVGETPVGAFAWDNDGLGTQLSETLEESLQLGLMSGFSFMWRPPAHAIPTAVRARLAQVVAPKQTHRVVIDEVEPSSARAFREALGSSLPSYSFDGAMKLAKVKASHAALTAEERGRRFADAFSRPDAVPAAALPKLAFLFDLAHSIAPAARTPELLAEVLRLDDRPTTRITYRIESTKSGLPAQLGDRYGNERVLASVPSFSGLRQAWGQSLDVLMFCPGDAVTQPPRVQLTTEPSIDGPRTVAFLDTSAAAGIAVGTHAASALAPGLNIG